MLQAQADLLRILGGALFGNSDDLNDLRFSESEWAAIMNEAQAQTVFSIVFNDVKEQLQKQVSTEEFKKYERLNLGFDASAVRSRFYHNDTHTMLAEHDIRYVILKGMSSAMYYPDPKLRSMGDVDFLVDKDHVQAADELLISRGFVKNKNTDSHDFHWSYNKNADYRELHWEPPGIPRKDNEMLRKYFSDILDYAQLIEMDDVSFWAPSVFHHGLILLLHTVGHLTNMGVGLRHLVDWLVFENTFSGEEFAELFSKPLKEIGLWRFAQVMTRTGILYLGCEERDWCAGIDEQICSLLMDDIISGGNFGRKDTARTMQSFLVRNSDTKRITEGKELIPNIFANINKVIRLKYPVMNKHRFLVPVGWVFVGSRYLFKVAVGKRKFFLSKDSMECAKMRTDVYSELKLFEIENTE